MRAIGELLRGLVPSLKEDDIISALREQCARMDRGERKLLGEILLERGLIGETDLRAALARQEREGRNLFVRRVFSEGEASCG